MERVLKETSIPVPKNTGIDGFLHTLRVILKLPRVQTVMIDASGKVTYSRYVQIEEEESGPSIDFTGIQPWALARQANVQECFIPSHSAAVVALALIDLAYSEALYPFSFIAGENTILWDWYFKTTGINIKDRQRLGGLPVYADKEVPSTVLVLCAALESGAAMTNVSKAYKIEMSMTVRSAEVDIL